MKPREFVLLGRRIFHLLPPRDTRRVYNTRENYRVHPFRPVRYERNSPVDPITRPTADRITRPPQVP